MVAVGLLGKHEITGTGTQFAEGEQTSRSLYRENDGLDYAVLVVVDEVQGFFDVV